MQDITKWRLHDVTFINYKYYESEDFDPKFVAGVDWFRGEDPWSHTKPERNKHRRKTFDLILFFWKWHIHIEFKGKVVGEIYRGKDRSNSEYYRSALDKLRKKGTEQ